MLKGFLLILFEFFRFKVTYTEKNRLLVKLGFLLRREHPSDQRRSLMWTGNVKVKITKFQKMSFYRLYLNNAQNLKVSFSEFIEKNILTISSPGNQYPSCSIPAFEPLQPTVRVSTIRPSFTAKLSWRVVSFGCIPWTRDIYLNTEKNKFKNPLC